MDKILSCLTTILINTIPKMVYSKKKYRKKLVIHKTRESLYASLRVLLEDAF